MSGTLNEVVIDAVSHHHLHGLGCPGCGGTDHFVLVHYHFDGLRHDKRRYVCLNELCEWQGYIERADHKFDAMGLRIVKELAG